MMVVEVTESSNSQHPQRWATTTAPRNKRCSEGGRCTQLDAIAQIKACKQGRILKQAQRISNVNIGAREIDSLQQRVSGEEKG
jgi:hypothetical protein